MSNNIELNSVIDFLRELRNSCGPRITRKEIAVWTAVVFFITMLYTFLTSFINDKNLSFFSIGIYSLIIFVLFILFLIFIHTLFGSLADEIAAERALTVLIFKLMSEKKLPSNINFKMERRRRLPIFIQREVDYQHKIVRKLKWHKKFCIPFYYLNRRYRIKICSFEKQEGIIYDVLLLITLTALIYLIKDRLILLISSLFNVLL